MILTGSNQNQVQVGVSWILPMLYRKKYGLRLFLVDQDGHWMIFYVLRELLMNKLIRRQLHVLVVSYALGDRCLFWWVFFFDGWFFGSWFKSSKRFNYCHIIKIISYQLTEVIS